MSSPRRSRRTWIVVLIGALVVAGLWLVAASEPPEAGPEQEHVIVLHGLGMAPPVMWILELQLEEAGYRVHNIGYSSTEKDFDGLLTEVSEKIDACCSGVTTKLHFVTHSLGGLIVRGLLDGERPRHLGRVVMLAPPNKGSEIVDELGDQWLFKFVLGPTGEALGTDPDGVAGQLGRVDYPVGVIAGTSRFNPLGYWLLPGDHDGTVSVESTKLEGMTDFIVVPHSHTFIMNSPDVAAEVIHFLRHGRFSRSFREKEPEDGEKAGA
jgi:triacylglycerol lipase